MENSQRSAYAELAITVAGKIRSQVESVLT